MKKRINFNFFFFFFLRTCFSTRPPRLCAINRIGLSFGFLFWKFSQLLICVRNKRENMIFTEFLGLAIFKACRKVPAIASRSWIDWLFSSFVSYPYIKIQARGKLFGRSSHNHIWLLFRSLKDPKACPPRPERAIMLFMSFYWFNSSGLIHWVGRSSDSTLRPLPGLISLGLFKGHHLGLGTGLSNTETWESSLRPHPCFWIGRVLPPLELYSWVGFMLASTSSFQDAAHARNAYCSTSAMFVVGQVDKAPRLPVCPASCTL